MTEPDFNPWAALPPPPGEPQRPRRGVLLGSIGGGLLLVAAVVAATVNPHHLHTSSSDDASLPLPTYSPDPVVTTDPIPTPKPTEVTLSPRTYYPGHCYTWSQALGRQDAVDVPCSTPHLVESVATVELNGLADAPYPTDTQMRKDVDAVCAKPVKAYLHGSLDPDGRYFFYAVTPTSEAWADGTRSIHCDLRHRHPFSYPEADFEKVVAFSGKVDLRHQEDLWPTGTCIRYKEPHTGSVVCTADHHTEAVGTVTVNATKHPSESRLEDLVADTCRREVSSYVGHRFHDTGSQFVSWDIIDGKRWTAGERAINCYLAFAKDDKNTDVKGSHAAGKSA